MEYKRNNVMIIDDDIALNSALEIVLQKYNIGITTYSDSFSALKELALNKYDILIVNYILDGIKGDQIIQMVRDTNKDIYIILMSSHKDLAPSIDIMRSLEIQAFFEKGANFDDLILLIESGYKYIAQMESIKSMSARIENFGVEFATALKNAVGARDNYTREHSNRVATYIEAFANFLKLDSNSVKLLTLAANFHDIGKIGISDNILLKQDSLTEEEYAKIKEHPVIGENILSSSEVFKDILPIIRHHHERIDGTGYPDGLKGETIPIEARMLSICDTFDAITSVRVYSDNMSVDAALREIERVKDSQLDEKLATSFCKFAIENTEYIETIMKMR